MKDNVIVVKVGTKCIFENGKLKKKTADSIALEMLKLKKKGTSTILVVSGAVELGKMILGLQKRPEKKIGLQRCAGVGQTGLMEIWSRSLRKYEMTSSQYLVTYRNFETVEEQKNIISNLNDDIENGIVPVINFNDKVDCKEVGLDNDRLSSMIAVYAEAKHLILLTNDVAGFMDEKGLVRNVALADIEKYKKLCNGAGESGTGGMRTKLEAAEMVAKNGGECAIANVNCKINEIISGFSECTRIKK